MKYEAVTASDNINGSKATEKKRNEYNVQFETIATNNTNLETGKAYSSNDIIRYQHDSSGGYKSSLIYDYPEEYGGQYHIEGTTTLNTPFTGISAYNSATDVITDVNLGVYIREQPDIALANDIEDITIQINHKTFTYTYGGKIQNNGDSIFDVQNKFVVNLNYSYQREVYHSDIEYQNQEEKDREMTISVKYKTIIKNQSDTLYMEPTQIVTYYDSNYDGIESVYAESGLSVNYSSNSYYGGNSYGGYKTAFININGTITPGGTKSIYTTYTLKKEAIFDNATQDVKPIKLKNVVEINAYSTYKNGNAYAGIDKDSASGNAIPGNVIRTYEDDTDKAPELSIVKSPKNRTIEGLIFYDNFDGEKDISEETQTGEERISDGLYTSGKDKLVKGVKVELVEKINKGNNTYSQTRVTADVKADGTYRLEDYIPGDYYIKFTWGKNTYIIGENTDINVYQYKSTIYPERTNSYGNKWYLNDIYERSGGVSSAVDDEQERYDIDNSIKVIDCNNNINKMDQNKTIDAFTQTMDLGVEKMVGNSASALFGRATIPEYTVRNIDFGIIERPRMEIRIEKEISRMEIYIANGQKVVDANVVTDENGNKKIEGITKNVTYIPKSQANSGSIIAGIENEILQNATLRITYKYTLINNSEIDFVIADPTSNNVTDNYLYYKTGDYEGKVKKIINNIGEAPTQTGTLKPEETTSTEVADQTKVVSQTENAVHQSQVSISTNLISDYLDKELSYSKEDNSEKWNQSSKQEIANNLYEEVQESKVDDYYKIMTTDQLKDINLYAKQKKEINFVATKVLYTTTLDMNYKNNIELLEVDKTGGGYVKNVIPGDYIPRLGSNQEINGGENDDDLSEDVGIIPPTGDNSNIIYIEKMIILLTASGVLILGIILIKKIVLPQGYNEKNGRLK